MADKFIFTVKGIKALEKFAQRPINKRTKITEEVRKDARESLLIGRQTAKDNAPVLSGLLRSSIQFRSPRKGGGSVVNLGKLFVDLDKVPYARRQNYEHKTHKFFMEKGLDATLKELERRLSGKRLEAIIIPKG